MLFPRRKASPNGSLGRRSWRLLRHLLVIAGLRCSLIQVLDSNWSPLLVSYTSWTQTFRALYSMGWRAHSKSPHLVALLRSPVHPGSDLSTSAICQQPQVSDSEVHTCSRTARNCHRLAHVWFLTWAYRGPESTVLLETKAEPENQPP